MQLQIENLGKVAVTVEQGYWDVNKDYDKLTIVEIKDNFATYISRKPVPAGTEVTNREYWIPFSSLKEEIVLAYNQWVEHYGSIINNHEGRITVAEQEIELHDSEIFEQQTITNKHEIAIVELQAIVNRIIGEVYGGPEFYADKDYCAKEEDTEIVFVGKAVGSENAKFYLLDGFELLYETTGTSFSYTHVMKADTNTTFRLISVEGEKVYKSDIVIKSVLPIILYNDDTKYTEQYFANIDDVKVTINLNVASTIGIAIPNNFGLQYITYNGMVMPFYCMDSLSKITRYKTTNTYKKGTYDLVLHGKELKQEETPDTYFIGVDKVDASSNKQVSIPGRLECVSSDGIVANAADIKDSSLNKKQSTINKDLTDKLNKLQEDHIEDVNDITNNITKIKESIESPNGIASLDENGLVPIYQLPEIYIYNIGHFYSTYELSDALRNNTIITNNKRFIIYFTIGTANVGGYVLQTINAANNNCRQFLFFENTVKYRDAKPNGNTTDWFVTNPHKINYDANTNTITLLDIDNKKISYANIGTANETKNGLLAYSDQIKLNKIPNDTNSELSDIKKNISDNASNIQTIEISLETLLNGNPNEAINNFNEIIKFLEGVEDKTTLQGILAGVQTDINDVQRDITNINSNLGGVTLESYNTGITLIPSEGSTNDFAIALGNVGYDVEGIHINSDVNIGSRTQIDADTKIGANVAIASGAIIGTDSDVTKPSNVTIGNNVNIKENVEILSNVHIRYGAKLQTNASIGTEVTIEDYAKIGCCNIGNGVVIGTDIYLCESDEKYDEFIVLSIGKGAPNAIKIGHGAFIDSNVSIYSSIPNDVSISSNVIIGRQVYINAGASIGYNAMVGDDALIGSSIQLYNYMDSFKLQYGTNPNYSVDSYIGHGVSIGSNLTITGNNDSANLRFGSEINLGNFIDIGDNIFIENDVNIGSNITIGRNVNIAESINIESSVNLEIWDDNSNQLSVGGYSELNNVKIYYGQGRFAFNSSNGSNSFSIWDRVSIGTGDKPKNCYTYIGCAIDIHNSVTIGSSTNIGKNVYIEDGFDSRNINSSSSINGVNFDTESDSHYFGIVDNITNPTHLNIQLPKFLKINDIDSDLIIETASGDWTIPYINYNIGENVDIDPNITIHSDTVGLYISDNNNFKTTFYGEALVGLYGNLNIDSNNGCLTIIADDNKPILIKPNVELGTDTCTGENVDIGYNVYIGDNINITISNSGYDNDYGLYSYYQFINNDYARTVLLGDDVIINRGVKIGTEVQAGEPYVNVSIDRDVFIKKEVHIDNQVHIGRAVFIGTEQTAPGTYIGVDTNIPDGFTVYVDPNKNDSLVIELGGQKFVLAHE